MTDKIKSFTGEYRFLSNFVYCQIVYECEMYKSIEHAYQAAKTEDEDERTTIRVTEKASRAKLFGRKVTLRAGWDEMKLSVMRELLRQKFEQEPFKTKLLATGESKIIEGNFWHDTFYGRCVCPTHKGRGENHLGILLMEIRSELRGEPVFDLFREELCH